MAFITLFGLLQLASYYMIALRLALLGAGWRGIVP